MVLGLLVLKVLILEILLVKLVLILIAVIKKLLLYLVHEWFLLLGVPATPTL